MQQGPVIYPVINIIGGPPGPSRNGGTWRPVKWWMFLHERVPAYLCSVMHGLDYRVQGAAWEEWISRPFGDWLEEWTGQTEYSVDPARHDTGYPFRSWMRHWPTFQQPPAVYRPLAFVDSGGFSLMNKAAFQKAHDWYGISTGPDDILKLQQRIGADMVASLDYPLPPGLTPSEIRHRQERSIANAVRLMELVEPDGPLAFLAVHGTSRDEARRHTDQVLSRVDTSRRFGLAIGSLVPRADNPRTVVEIVQGVVEAVSEYGIRPPIHAFGVTNHLMASLAHLGVTSFDSTTYVDVAQRAGWLDAQLRPVHVRDVSERDMAACNCDYCAGIIAMGILPRMQYILSREGEKADGVAQYYHELLPGEYCTRSDMYGLLAMHNWRQIQRERQRVEEAQIADQLPMYIAQLAREHSGQRGNRLTDALAWLADAREDQRLNDAMRHTMGRIVAPVTRVVRQVVERPKFSPDAFSVPANYRPPHGRDILLILACSKGKPYRASSHQRQVLTRIEAAYPDGFQRIHRVTLSGLYGPVPEEFEDLPQVVDYDYQLQPGETEQAALVAERLREYLQRHGAHYGAVVSYIYYPAYRAALEMAIGKTERICPAVPVRRGKPAHYLGELIDCLAPAMGVGPINGPQLRFAFA